MRLPSLSSTTSTLCGFGAQTQNRTPPATTFPGWAIRHTCRPFVWRRTNLPTLEDEEPVLHDGQGPLAFRKLGIPKDKAQSLVAELL